MGIQDLGLTWRDFCGRIRTLKKSLGFRQYDFLDNSCFAPAPVVKRNMTETEQDKAKFSVKLLRDSGIAPPVELLIAAGYQDEVDEANRDTIADQLKTAM